MFGEESPLLPRSSSRGFGSAPRPRLGLIPARLLASALVHSRSELHSVRDRIPITVRITTHTAITIHPRPRRTIRRPRPYITRQRGVAGIRITPDITRVDPRPLRRAADLNWELYPFGLRPLLSERSCAGRIRAMPFKRRVSMASRHSLQR